MKKLLTMFTATILCLALAGPSFGAYDFSAPSENATIGKKRAWKEGNFTTLTATNQTQTAANITTATITTANITNLGAGYLNPRETVTAANVLTTAECGKIMVLSSATEFATTLPAVASSAGCGYRMLIGAAASSGNYSIITGNSLENKIQGHINVAGTPAACADEDTVKLIDGNTKGDFVDLWSDGTSWWITGLAVTAGKLTCTQAD